VILPATTLFRAKILKQSVNKNRGLCYEHMFAFINLHVDLK